MSKIAELLQQLIREVSDESELASMEMSTGITKIMQGMEVDKNMDDASLSLLIANDAVRPYLSRIRFYGDLKNDLCDMASKYQQFLQTPVRVKETPSQGDAAKPFVPDRTLELFDDGYSASFPKVTPYKGTPLPPIEGNTFPEGKVQEKQPWGDVSRMQSSPDFTGGEEMKRMVLCAMSLELHNNGFCGGRMSEICRATEKFMREHRLLKAKDMELQSNGNSTFLPRVHKQAQNAIRSLNNHDLTTRLADGNWVLTEHGKKKAKEVLKEGNK